MSTVLDRAWYNTLVDDDGSNTVGTLWNKAAVSSLMTTIDQVFAGALEIVGPLTVTSFGTHAFTSSGGGVNRLQVRNTAAGAANGALLDLGDETDASAGQLIALSASFASAGGLLASSTILRGLRANGLSLVADHAAAPIRFYTGGTTLRAQFYPAGGLAIGVTAADPGAPGKVTIKGGFSNLLDLTPTADVTGGLYMTFRNAAGSAIGSISQLAGAASIAFNTSSDQRFKADRGLATDLAGLRALQVHDFTWTVDGTVDRGVFAQEAFAAIRRGVTPGSEGDDFSRPWMVDRSAYVPDLIVGWQQHDAALAALTARVHALEQGRP